MDGYVKRAWIRNPDAPLGQPAKGRINCPCGHAPESEYNPDQPNINCACGTIYTWDGWIVSKPDDDDELQIAKALGFSSVAAMQDHQAWLDRQICQ